MTLVSSNNLTLNRFIQELMMSFKTETTSFWAHPFMTTKAQVQAPRFSTGCAAALGKREDA